jgi:palmitoyltransferase
MVKTPLKYLRKSSSTPLFFICLMLANYALISLTILPYFNEDCKPWFVVDSILFGLTFLFFTLSAFRDPGYLSRHKKIPFLNMLKNFDPVLLCPDCEVIRTNRSRHCSICNQCVERFDHHCPWVNNCVGTKNHHFFMLFLSTVTVLLLSVLVTVARIINIELKQEGTFANSECFLTVLPEIIYTPSIFLISCVLVLFSTIFFLLPVLLLGLI